MKTLLACCLTLFAASAQAVATSASAAASAGSDTDVRRAFSLILDTGGFRGYAQGRVFGPQLPAMAGDVDVIFPDRIHASTDDLEFIAIGAHAWISTLGVWAAVDRSLVPVTAFDMTALRKAIASITNATLEGSAKTAGCAARVYRFRANGNLPGTAANGDLRAWICEASGKLSRVEAIDARTHERVIFDFDWSRRPDVRPPGS